MIKLEKVFFNYSATDEKVIPALQGIDLEFEEGEFISIIGPNGSGKTTLAKLLNGILLPSSGKVLVDGLNTKDKKDLRSIRRRVGMVFQNPDNQLITTSVQREIAFGLENLNLPYEEIRERVEWALSAFQLWKYKEVPPHRLSGGEKQKVALAGILAMRPQYLVLDEPTSILDPEGREMLILLIRRLSDEGKLTILNITQFPDEAILAKRLLVLDKGKVLLDGPPEKVFEEEELIKKIGLSLPKCFEIANQLKSKGLKIKRKVTKIDDLLKELLSFKEVNYPLLLNKAKVEKNKPQLPDYKQIELENLGFIYNPGDENPNEALKDINLNINQGELIGLIGPAGSGKSTLVQQMNGLLFPTSGKIKIDGLELKEKAPYLKRLRQKVGLVFQFPERQLFEESVYKDIAFGPRNLGLEKAEVEKRVKNSLEIVGLDFKDFAYRSPFSLSSGEQRRVALAGVLALEPEVLVLDEPTAGLDSASIDRVKEIILVYKKRGSTIILISHNLELVAEICERIIFLKQGRVLFDGSKRDFFKWTTTHEEGIGPPDILKLLHGLRSAGFQIKEESYAVEELVRELFAIFGKGIDKSKNGFQA